MGAKAWFIAYLDGPDALARLPNPPAFDPEATEALARRLFPDRDLTPGETGDLSMLAPDENDLVVGAYGPLRIAAHLDLALDRPSQLPARWLEPGGAGLVCVFGLHSVVDWFAFATWRAGALVRALSLAPDDGVIETIGEPMPAEAPFWAGERALEMGGDADEAYPPPFHPHDLAPEIMADLVGFSFEGDPSQWRFDPFDTPAQAYAVAKKKPWWRPW